MLLVKNQYKSHERSGCHPLAGIAPVGPVFGSFHPGWARKEGSPVPQTDKLHTGFSRVSSVLSLFFLLLIKDSMSACLKVIFSPCVCCLSTGEVVGFLTFHFVLRCSRLTVL